MYARSSYTMKKSFLVDRTCPRSLHKVSRHGAGNEWLSRLHFDRALMLEFGLFSVWVMMLTRLELSVPVVLKMLLGVGQPISLSRTYTHSHPPSYFVPSLSSTTFSFLLLCVRSTDLRVSIRPWDSPPVLAWRQPALPLHRGLPRRLVWAAQERRCGNRLGIPFASSRQYREVP